MLNDVRIPEGSSIRYEELEHRQEKERFFQSLA